MQMRLYLLGIKASFAMQKELDPLMMNLNKRAVLILKHIIHSAEPVNGAELAAILGTTSKTVGIEIKNISEILKNFGADIISQKGTGYMLRVFDKAEFEIFAQCFNEKMLNESEWTYYPAERIDFILYHLCFDKQYIKSSEAAEKLFISPSTLAVDLKRVRSVLDAYHLRMTHKPFYGIAIEGKERHRRCLMIKYMYNNEEEAYLDSEKLNLRLDSRHVQETVKHLFIQNKIHVSIKNLEEITRYIIISDYRFEEGYEAECENICFSIIEKTAEYRLACKIAGILSILPAERERKNLACFILSRRNFTCEEELELSYRARISVLTEGIAHFFHVRNKIDMNNNRFLKKRLLLELASMYMRLVMGFECRQQNIKAIKKNAAVFEYVLSISDYLYREEALTIREYDMTVFYYLLEECIETKFKTEGCADIIYVFLNGLSTAYYYAGRIQKKYSRHIKTEQFKEFYELAPDDYHSHTVVITDIPKQRFLTERVSIFQITEHLNSKEMTQLGKVLMQSTKANSSLMSAFSKGIFMKEIDAADRESVLKYMSERFLERGYASEDFPELMMAREQLATSELDNGVALLTGLYETSEETICGIGILKKPILWKNEYVQLIFTVSKGKDVFIVMKSIQKIIENSKTVHKLITSECRAEALQIICDTL